VRRLNVARCATRFIARIPEASLEDLAQLGRPDCTYLAMPRSCSDMCVKCAYQSSSANDSWLWNGRTLVVSVFTLMGSGQRRLLPQAKGTLLYKNHLITRACLWRLGSIPLWGLDTGKTIHGSIGARGL
jgi:hypothetical protein